MPELSSKSTGDESDALPEPHFSSSDEINVIQVFHAVDCINDEITITSHEDQTADYNQNKAMEDKSDSNNSAFHLL